jgi:hypothetical protein
MKNLIGKRVKIKSATSGHNIPLGTSGLVERVQGNQHFIKGHIAWVGINDLELCPMTREEIQKEISSLEEQIKVEQEKLQFMSDSNVEEFDETQYKVFKTLATLDNKDISAMEKSKLIASLING